MKVRPVTCDKLAPCLACKAEHAHKNVATKNPHNSQSALHDLTCNKVNQSHYMPEVPRGFQEVKVPRLRDNGPGWW